MTSYVAAAILTVDNYVKRRSGMHGLDPDVVHAVNVGAPSEAELSLSDLRAILSEITRLRGKLAATCSMNEVHGRVFERHEMCNECDMTREEYHRVLYPDGVGA
jgi:hypothetical protein